MKQIIVMISMVILGLAIAAVVMGFQDDVEAMGTATTSALSTMQSKITL